MQTWLGVVSINRGLIADTDLWDVAMDEEDGPLGRFFRRWVLSDDDGLLCSFWTVVDGGIIWCIILEYSSTGNDNEDDGIGTEQCCHVVKSSIFIISLLFAGFGSKIYGTALRPLQLFLCSLFTFDLVQYSCIGDTLYSPSSVIADRTRQTDTTVDCLITDRG